MNAGRDRRAVATSPSSATSVEPVVRALSSDPSLSRAGSCSTKSWYRRPSRDVRVTRTRIASRAGSVTTRLVIRYLPDFAVLTCVKPRLRASGRLTRWRVSVDSRSVKVRPSVTMSSRLRTLGVDRSG